MIKVLFMGSPDFSVSALKKLTEYDGTEVVAVISQEDKPKGRGYEMMPTPVKEYALSVGIPVYTPHTLRDNAISDLLHEINPDVIVVVAYGKILPDEVLSIAKYGAINVHASLLPKYRGSAPIQWAVLNGDNTTGVSTMYLASEMDTGDIIYSAETEIGEFETSGELFDRLMVLGADVLVNTLRDIESGTAPRTPQEHDKASYVKMLDKSISPIDWSKSPREVIKWIYGLQPWPVATMNIEDATFKVYSAEYTDNSTNKAPGTIVYAGKKGIEIACGNGQTIMVTELQAPGKKRMKASDYLLGHPIKIED